MRKLIILLIFSIAFTSILVAQRIAILDEILQPKSLHVVDGNIYILDQCKANILSMDNFKLIRKIGSRGEGPGQLLGNCGMVVTGNTVTLLGGLKIVVFSTGGKLLKEKRFNFMFGNLQPLGNHYVFNMQTTENGDAFSDFVLLDENLVIGKSIYKSKTDSSFPKAGFGKKAVQLINFTKFVRTGDDKIFIVNTHEGFSIKLLNLKGESIGKITKKIAKVKIPQSAKDAKIKNFLKTFSPKQIEKIRKKFEFIFPENYPAIQDLQISGNNLLIRTYAEQNDKRVYYKTSITGKYFKKIRLPIENPWLSYFSGNVVYYLKENPENEVWELYREKI